ncbi:MAG: DM13 domain-containing protein, partial [Acidimicrobiales bacterium]
LLGVIVLCGLLLAACGGGDDDGGLSSTPSTSPTTSTPVREGPRAAPRWETVNTFDGTGTQRTPAFEILSDAIQWRVRWTCESGTLQVLTDPPPRKPKPVVDATCDAGKGVGYAIHTGTIAMDVTATGPWQIIVDQQIDFPLDEPPLPGMAGAPVLVEGSFYDLENRGTGTARIYQLPDGTRALRFEDFEVTQNTDLFIRLSEAPEPKNSADTVNSPFVEIANLKSTAGNQNYLIPADVPTGRIRSVVIWCAPVSIAYAAAALSAP